MTTSPRLLAKTDVRGHVVRTVKVGANWMTTLDLHVQEWSATPDEALRTHQRIVTDVEEGERA